MPSFFDAHDSAIVQQFATRLCRPDPTYGWQGDPDLVLSWENLANRWEIYRQIGDGEPVGVLKGPVGMPLNEETFSLLLRRLASVDTTNRGVDHMTIVDDYLASVEKDEVDRTRAAADQTAEALEKVYYGLMRDRGDITNAIIHAPNPG